MAILKVSIPDDTPKAHAELMRRSFEAQPKGKPVNTTGINLRNLAGFSLYGAWLYRADLRNAQLQGAYLERANLLWTKMQGADLQEADLQETDLFAASLPIETFFLSRNWQTAKNLNMATFYYGDQKVVGFSLSADGKPKITLPLRESGCQADFQEKATSDAKTIHIADIPADKLRVFGFDKRVIKALQQNHLPRISYRFH